MKNYHVVIVLVVLTFFLWVSSASAQSTKDVQVIESHQFRDSSRADELLLESLGLKVDMLQNGSVNRAQMCRLAVEMMGRSSTAEALNRVPLEFADAREVPADLRGYVAVAAAYGLVDSGRKVFLRPLDSINLGESLVIMLRLMGKDPTADAGYPLGPLMSAEEKGLLDHIPTDLRWDAFMNETQMIRLVAAVSRRSPAHGAESGIAYHMESDELHLFGSEGEEVITLAPEILVIGAETLEAVMGHMVRVYFNSDGKAVALETHSEITTSRGKLTDYQIAGGKLRLDEAWHEAVINSEAFTWSFNGMGMTGLTGDALSDQLLSWYEEGVQVILHTDSEGMGRAEVISWDVEEAVVTDVQMENEKVHVELKYAGPWGVQPAAVTFDAGRTAGVEGDCRSISQLQKGDVVSAATVGGWGMLSDGELIHRLRVTRSRYTAAFKPGRYGTANSSEDGFSYILLADNGDKISLDPQRYLSDLDVLLERTVVAELSLSSDGIPLYAEPLVLADEEVPVQFCEFWESSEGTFVQVDYEGIQVEYEVAEEFDVLPELKCDELCPMLVNLGFDDSYRVREITRAAERVWDLDGAGSDEQVIISSFNSEEGYLTVRVDNEHTESGYVLIVDPLLYDPEGELVILQDIEVGQQIIPFKTADRHVVVVK